MCGWQTAYFFPFRICPCWSGKEYVITINGIKMPFSTGFLSGYSGETLPFHLAVRQSPTNQARAPPAEALPSHPPLSLPCSGWKAAVTITEPSLGLLLQESSQDTQTLVREGQEWPKRWKMLCKAQDFSPAGKSPCPSGDGHTWGGLASHRTEWISHMLPSAGKSWGKSHIQCVIYKEISVRQREKLFLNEHDWRESINITVTYYKINNKNSFSKSMVWTKICRNTKCSTEGLIWISNVFYLVKENQRV